MVPNQGAIYNIHSCYMTFCFIISIVTISPSYVHDPLTCTSLTSSHCLPTIIFHVNDHCLCDLFYGFVLYLYFCVVPIFIIHLFVFILCLFHLFGILIGTYTSVVLFLHDISIVLFAIKFSQAACLSNTFF